MLQVDQLLMNFIFAKRIVTAWSVEIDDVTGTRILQSRLSGAQRSFKNRWEFHVTVAAVGQGVLGDDGRRRSGR